VHLLKRIYGMVGMEVMLFLLIVQIKLLLLTKVLSPEEVEEVLVALLVTLAEEGVVPEVVKAV
jgi:hypothetical protein